MRGETDGGDRRGRLSDRQDLGIRNMILPESDL